MRKANLSIYLLEPSLTTSLEEDGKRPLRKFVLRIIERSRVCNRNVALHRLRSSIVLAILAQWCGEMTK